MTFAASMARLRRLTVPELLAKRERIEIDPASRSSPGSFETYTRPARRHLALITRAIAEKTAAEKKGRAA